MKLEILLFVNALVDTKENNVKWKVIYTFLNSLSKNLRTDLGSARLKILHGLFSITRQKENWLNSDSYFRKIGKTLFFSVGINLISTYALHKLQYCLQVWLFHGRRTVFLNRSVGEHFTSILLKSRSWWIYVIPEIHVITIICPCSLTYLVYSRQSFI